MQSVASTYSMQAHVFFRRRKTYLYWQILNTTSVVHVAKTQQIPATQLQKDGLNCLRQMRSVAIT